MDQSSSQGALVSYPVVPISKQEVTDNFVTLPEDGGIVPTWVWQFAVNNNDIDGLDAIISAAAGWVSQELAQQRFNNEQFHGMLMQTIAANNNGLNHRLDMFASHAEAQHNIIQATFELERQNQKVQHQLNNHNNSINAQIIASKGDHQVYDAAVRMIKMQAELEENQREFLKKVLDEKMGQAEKAAQQMEAGLLKNIESSEASLEKSLRHLSKRTSDNTNSTDNQVNGLDLRVTALEAAPPTDTGVNKRSLAETKEVAIAARNASGENAEAISDVSAALETLRKSTRESSSKHNDALSAIRKQLDDAEAGATATNQKISNIGGEVSRSIGLVKSLNERIEKIEMMPDACAKVGGVHDEVKAADAAFKKTYNAHVAAQEGKAKTYASQFEGITDDLQRQAASIEDLQEIIEELKRQAKAQPDRAPSEADVNEIRCEIAEINEKIRADTGTLNDRMTTLEGVVKDALGKACDAVSRPVQDTRIETVLTRLASLEEGFGKQTADLDELKNLSRDASVSPVAAGGNAETSADNGTGAQLLNTLRAFEESIRIARSQPARETSTILETQMMALNYHAQVKDAGWVDTSEATAKGVFDEAMLDLLGQIPPLNFPFGTMTNRRFNMVEFIKGHLLRYIRTYNADKAKFVSDIRAARTRSGTTFTFTVDERELLNKVDAQITKGREPDEIDLFKLLIIKTKTEQHDMAIKPAEIAALLVRSKLLTPSSAAADFVSQAWHSKVFWHDNEKTTLDSLPEHKPREPTNKHTERKPATAQPPKKVGFGKKMAGTTTDCGMIETELDTALRRLHSEVKSPSLLLKAGFAKDENIPTTRNAIKKHGKTEIFIPLHDGRDQHWLLGVLHGPTLFLYDSLPCHQERQDRLRDMLAELTGRAPVIKVMQCPQQPAESTDCGLHAIFNAYCHMTGVSCKNPDLAKLKTREGPVVRQIARTLEEVCGVPVTKVFKSKLKAFSNSLKIGEQITATWSEEGGIKHVWEGTVGNPHKGKWEVKFIVNGTTFDGIFPEEAITYHSVEKCKAVTNKTPKAVKKTPVANVPVGTAPVAQQAAPTPSTEHQAKAPMPRNVVADAIAPPPTAKLTPVEHDWRDFWTSHVKVPDMAGMKGEDLARILHTLPSPQQQLVLAGHVPATVAEHRNTLHLIRARIDANKDLQMAPIIDALVMFITAEHNARNWRWSTTLKKGCSLQGALSMLPKYAATTTGLRLGMSPQWRQTIRRLTHLCKEETPNQPQVATIEEIQAMISNPTVTTEEKVCLMLGWTTAARLGCVTQLKAEDITWKEQEASVQHLAVTFRRGKGVKASGPYTVVSSIPIAWATSIKEHLTTTGLGPNWIFKKKTDMGKCIKGARPQDSKLEQRSIRRGALQAIALGGATEETLMRFSGHQRVATLRRYLGWNTKNKKVHAEMLDAAKPLLPTAPPAQE